MAIVILFPPGSRDHPGRSSRASSEESQSFDSSAALALEMATSGNVKPEFWKPVDVDQEGAKMTARYPDSQWESKKERIRQLYLDENLPLIDVMETMIRECDFRPTVKMYKDHFRKWKWHKNDSPGLRKNAAAGSKYLVSTGNVARKQRRFISSGFNPAFFPRTLNRPDFPLFYGRLAHTNDVVGQLEGAYRSLSQFMHHDSQMSPSWKNCGRLEYISPVDECAETLCLTLAALYQFDTGQFALGGLVMRRTFIRIENTIIERGERMDTIYGVCLSVPQLLILSGRLEILDLYLAHFLQMTRHVGGAYAPYTAVLRAVQRCREVSDRAGLLDFVETAMKLWTDKMVALRGMDDINSALSVFSFAEKRLGPEVVMEAGSRVVSLFREALDTYGEESPITDKLAELYTWIEAICGIDSDKFVPWCERQLGKMEAAVGEEALLSGHGLPTRIRSAYFSLNGCLGLCLVRLGSDPDSAISLLERCVTILMGMGDLPLTDRLCLEISFKPFEMLENMYLELGDKSALNELRRKRAAFNKMSNRDLRREMDGEPGPVNE